MVSQSAVKGTVTAAGSDAAGIPIGQGTTIRTNMVYVTMDLLTDGESACICPWSPEWWAREQWRWTGTAEGSDAARIPVGQGTTIRTNMVYVTMDILTDGQSTCICPWSPEW